MTVVQEVWGHRTGLIGQTRSTARSEAAMVLDAMRDDIRRHLLTSFSMRNATEHALRELEEVQVEANMGCGEAANAISPATYDFARFFVEALPTTAPSPEVSADPDGEIALDWIFGPKKALTVSIGPTGRCSFAWMLGKRTYSGTDWLDDGIPASIIYALGQLARDKYSPQTSR
jgi:hypothetical protein